jgi:carbonic anhydrase
MSELDAILAANASYATGFAQGDLPAPPSRRFAVVTCMDARLDPARYAGLALGDANVIRNAGGVVSDDVLRSLVISHWLLGTQEAFVVGHTDCRMEEFTDDQLRRKLADKTGADTSNLEFLTFPDVRSGVARSVGRIRESDLLPESFAARGLVYDVRTGRLEEVV